MCMLRRLALECCVFMHPVSVPVSVSVSVSVCPSVRLSVCLSVCLSLSLSLVLCIYHPSPLSLALPRPLSRSIAIAVG